MAETLTPRTRTPVCPAELKAECPWRPADWRWLRASWRVATGSRRGERQDDLWTRRAIRCVHALHRVARGRWPYRPEPELLQAWQLAERHDWQLAELEARVLADQPISEISSAMGLPTGAISAFEGIFFDVRPRLSRTSWVFHQVLGSKSWLPFEPEDVTLAWRSFAYRYGVSTLEALLAGAERLDLVRDGLPAYWSPTSGLPTELQFLLVTRSLPQHGRKVLRSLTRFVELGLCENPPYAAAPPTSLSLELSGGVGANLASWEEEFDTPDATSEQRFARVA